MRPLLQTQNLTIGYRQGNTPIVVQKEVGVALRAGELTALIGTNGVGKSTLLRTLAGLQPALSGDVLLGGRALAAYPPHELARQLSVVLTEPPASRYLTVRELVALGRHPYTNWAGKLTDQDDAAVTQALVATELTDLADRRCHTLSDGQLQRVLITRAVAQDTPLIILDEPTSHLDLHHAAYVLRLLKRLADGGKAVLFASHALDFALQVCDRLIVMQPEGVAQGSVAELVQSGVLSKLFPADLIRFNKAERRFLLR